MGVNTEDVKGWLRAQRICVLEEWVQACVEWIHQEHQGPAMSGNQLRQMVYEQWLDSDLSEIATPCLPPSIKQARDTKLAGSFALQVNSIQDISSPAYAQLVKLQGRENENASVSAAPPTQGKFEPKPSRLLMLSLTDGQQVVQAMEYRPVTCLRADLAPGTKILLSGNMRCKLGVILLTSAHVKILGGEVEALKETNSREKLLARAIGITPPEAPAGGHDQNRDPGITQIPQATTVTVPSRNRDPGITQIPQATTVTAPSRNNDAATTASTFNQQITNRNWNQQAKTTTAQDTSQRTKPKQDVKPGSAVHRSWGQGVLRFDAEELLDEEDGLDELMLEEIEMIERQQGNQQVKKEVSVKSEEADWDVDDIDEEELLAMEWENSEQPSHRQPSHRPHHPDTACKPQGLTRNIQGGRSSNSSSRFPTNTSTDSMNIKREQQKGKQDDTYLAKPLLNTAAGSSSTSMVGNKASRMTLPKSTAFASNAVPLFRATKDVPPSEQGRPKVEPRMTTPNPTAGSCSSMDGAPHKAASSRMAVATRFIKEEPQSQRASSSSSFVSPNESKDGPSLHSRKTGGQCSSIGSTGSSPKRRKVGSGSSLPCPFLYLINMADQLKRKESCQFDIKGFIMTLVSSLSHNPTWSLTAKINDGTMSLDVDISEQVLSELIGFTVKEMMQMKADLKKSNQENATQIKNHIKQGISQCQQSLMDFSCIMTLEMKPYYVRPKMIAFRHPTLDDARMLLDIITADS